MKIMVLDIGGTAIKAGICEGKELTDIREFPTQAMLGGAQVMKNVQEIIHGYRSRHAFERIGISTAGQVNPVEGSIIFANDNIPGYTGMRIAEMMEREFALPVRVENDVNAAAIGEAIFGAGQSHKDFACLTYGTGVGGALFTGGNPYRGSSYSAGEFGGIIVHPEDRRLESDIFSGCYERYASATALVQRGKAVDASLTDGRAIFARIGEPAVKAAIDAWIMEIVYGLISVVHIMNPACIILGGGVMEQEYVVTQVREKLYEHLIPSFRHVEICKATLGNRAGMLGASVLHELNP